MYTSNKYVVFHKTVLHAFNVCTSHVLARHTQMNTVFLYHIRYTHLQCTRHIHMYVFQKQFYTLYINTFSVHVTGILARHIHTNTFLCIILDTHSLNIHATYVCKPHAEHDFLRHTMYTCFKCIRQILTWVAFSQAGGVNRNL